MPQRKFTFAKGYIYHIFNRGHNKQDIFLHYKDFARYLQRLNEYKQKHSFTLLAYCLMPNHIHLLIQQTSDEPLERLIHRLHTAYTMYFNKKYERVGSVFQSRFKAKPVESDEYLLHVSRYIHLNPIELLRAQGRALNLKQYAWSSYAEYINISTSPLSNPEKILDYFNSHNSTHKERAAKYKAFVEDTIETLSTDRLEEISSGYL